jgi:hypothetical protein
MPHQLSDHSRSTVLAAARTMFPHDDLPDEAYGGVVSEVDGAAAGDSAVATDIEQGIAQLDDPKPFVELDEDARTDALRRSEGTALFDLIKATTVVALYDNPLVWKAFGYEGPSVHLGGYVKRGFDDLDWLPDPPIALDPTAGSHHS